MGSSEWSEFQFEVSRWNCQDPREDGHRWHLGLFGALDPEVADGVSKCRLGLYNTEPHSNAISGARTEGQVGERVPLSLRFGAEVLRIKVVRLVVILLVMMNRKHWHHHDASFGYKQTRVWVMVVFCRDSFESCEGWEQPERF